MKQNLEKVLQVVRDVPPGLASSHVRKSCHSDPPAGGEESASLHGNWNDGRTDNGRKGRKGGEGSTVLPWKFY